MLPFISVFTLLIVLTSKAYALLEIIMQLIKMYFDSLCFIFWRTVYSLNYPTVIPEAGLAGMGVGWGWQVDVPASLRLMKMSGFATVYKPPKYHQHRKL